MRQSGFNRFLLTGGMLAALAGSLMVNAGANPYVSVKLQGTPLETLSEVLELLSGDKKDEAAAGKGNRT